MSKRKVKPPSKVRQAAKKRVERKEKDLPPPGAPSTKRFLVLALLVVAAIGAAWALTVYLPKLPFIRGDLEPWLTYEKRLRQPEGQAQFYEYRPREVEKWLGGVRKSGADAKDLRLILDRAVRWLSIPDATRVIEAAHAAQSAHTSVVAEFALKLRAKTGTASAEERDCRARLDRVLGNPEDP